MRNLFTQEEITLCTFVAIYGPDDLVRMEDIHKLKGRNLTSIDLKIRNIAAMLDEKGIRRYSDVHPLSGVTTSEEGIRTNWEWVEPLTKLSKAQLLVRCRVLAN